MGLKNNFKNSIFEYGVGFLPTGLSVILRNTLSFILSGSECQECVPRSLGLHDAIEG